MECASEPDGIATGTGALPGARRRCEAGKRTHGPGTRACLALLAAAALLALAAPAQAQTEIWSATFTPAVVNSSTIGCSNFAATARCSSTAVLSDDDFTRNSTDYTVVQLSVNSSGTVTLSFDTFRGELDALTLVIGSTSLALADAIAFSLTTRSWNSTGVSLTVGTAVNVGLISTPADPDGVTVPALACDSDSNADNVLALVETSRHNTRPCAVSDDGQIRAIWTSAGSALLVEKADEGDDEPTLGNSPELRFTGEVQRRTKPDLHRFSCETLSGFGRVWHTSDAADHVITVDCGQASPPPPSEPLEQVTGVGVAPDNAQLVVTWTAVANATGYKVQWKSGSEGYNTGDRQATVTSGSTTRHTIPGLANGTAYTVRVSATRTGADDGLPSAEMTGTPTVSPPPPPPPLEQVTGVGVAPDNAQLVVTWTAVANATGYKVQWKSGSEGYNTGDRQATVTSGSTTRHTIPGLANGTAYTVRVSATRTGADDGLPSAEMTGTPTVSPPPPPPPLEQVTGVGVAPDNAQLVVTWTAVANATGYKVQWKSDSEDYNTGDRQATVTSGSTTHYTIPSLTNGTEYTVRVSATRTGATDGPPSAAETGTPRVPPPPPPPPPPPVTDLEQVMGVGVAPGDAQLVVTWTAVDDATGYTVQWRSGSQGYNTGDRQATVTSGSTTRYPIPSLTNGTEYTVRVIATRTGATDGPPSEEMTGTPAAPTLEPFEVEIVGVPDVAVTGESYELTAQSDEDSLVYAWSVDGGAIEPDDVQMVVWTAPETAGVAWIHVDVTREDDVTAGQSAYVRVEVPEPEPEPVPALPLLGQLLLALGLAGAGAMRLVRSARRP